MYFSTMSKLDKAIIAEAFQIDGNKNINYIILIATDAYSIVINNLDTKLVI